MEYAYTAQVVGEIAVAVMKGLAITAGIIAIGIWLLHRF